MKQVLIRRGKVRVEDVPAPLVEDGHILVEVVYSLISAGTEISTMEHSGQSLLKKALEQPEKVKKLLDYLKNQGIKKTFDKIKANIEYSIPIGYSCSGIVIQVGKDVENFCPGDFVACAGAGFANHAEVILVPKNLTVRVPEGCSLKDAASVALGAIAMQGVRRADPCLGEIVAVIGLGLLGQLTVQLLKVAGCRVVGWDLNSRRVELARKLGADYAFNPLEVDVKNEVLHLTEDHGFDATIITAASESDAIVQQAIEVTRKKGRVVVVGAVGLGLKRSPFYEKELDFLISCSYGPGRYDEAYENKGINYPYAYVRWTENRNMQEYLRLIAEGKIKLDNILEREYPIDKAEEAYKELQLSLNKPLGVILTYPSNLERPQLEKLATKVSFSNKYIGQKINVALIGAGNFAKDMHLPNIKLLSDLYHLRAVVDTMGLNAKETAEKFGADYATTDYNEVLNDPNIDMVMICTRHNTHAKLSMAAAKANKAVFVEKPMSLTKSELNELMGILERTGVPFLVGFNRRFSPSAQRAKEIIADRQNPVMIMYRMNAGYLPTDHWTQTEEGGGRIVGEACHIFDLFHFLIEAPAIEINSTMLAPKTNHILSSDNMVITLRFEDGSVATLLYTAIGSSEAGKEYVEIFVDGKTLIIDDYKSLKVFGTKIKGWKGKFQDKGHLEELKRFAKFVRGLEPAPIQLQELYNITKQTFIAAGHEDVKFNHV